MTGCDDAITRRDALKVGAGMAMAAGLSAALPLAGCGSDGRSASGSASGASEASSVGSASQPSEASASASSAAPAESAQPSGGPYDGYFPAHEPLGAGKGLHPGCVIWAYGPACVSWDGSGYWWELSHFDERTVRGLVGAALTTLTGENDAAKSRAALFVAHDGGVGYASPRA